MNDLASDALSHSPLCASPSCESSCSLFISLIHSTEPNPSTVPAKAPSLGLPTL